MVIPLYNKAATIIRALESIRSQQPDDLEIIVVDDGSTDEGPSLVEAYRPAWPGIRLIGQPNAGPGAARNRGIAAASGRYVSFLDADDEYLPGFFAAARGALAEHPSCQLFVAGHCRTRGGEKQSMRPYFERLGVTHGAFAPTPDLAPVTLLGILYYHHSGSIVCERAVVQQLGGFYDEHKCVFGEDSFLWLQVILNTTGFHSPEPLMWYHTEDSSLMIDGALTGREVPAFLAHPAQLRRTCPAPLRPLLEDVLGLCAVQYIVNLVMVNRGTLGDAEVPVFARLLREFPSSCKFEWYGYLAARMKTVELPPAAPSPIPWMRRFAA